MPHKLCKIPAAMLAARECTHTTESTSTRRADQGIAPGNCELSPLLESRRNNRLDRDHRRLRRPESIASAQQRDKQPQALQEIRAAMGKLWQIDFV